MTDEFSGAFGTNLAECFGLPAAPAFISRSIRYGQIAVTHIVCDAENNGLTAPLPHEDAFLVTLQLRHCPLHDLWLDGKPVRTAPLSAGTTCIYDLRRNPIVNSISAFTNLHFYFPRNALVTAAEGDDISFLDDLPHNPGVGIADPVIRDLGLALLPAFARPDEAQALFVDHIVTATAAYVSHLSGSIATQATAKCLAPWQEARAKELLTARLDGAISIAELARECGMSASAFGAAFRQSTGQSPHEWLLEVRIDRARRMIDARMPLSEVALACGFSNVEHLARVMERQASLER